MPDFGKTEKTKVDDSGMQSKANEISANINSITQAFQRISNALTDTLSPSWEDVSKEVFFARFRQDSSSFASHLESVNLLNEQLSEAVRVYVKAEEQVGAIVNDIKT